jgi:hypothetical protein
LTKGTLWTNFVKIIICQSFKAENTKKSHQLISKRLNCVAIHCKKSRRFSRRVNRRVADFSSKPAYSKQYCQPDQLGQPAKESKKKGKKEDKKTKEKKQP